MKKKKILETEDSESKNVALEFGKRVKKIRKTLQLSQRQFARDLGISGSFLSEIEYGKTRPGFDFFWNIHLKYNVDLYYLFKGTGDPFFIPEDQRPKQKLFSGPDSDIIEKMIWHFKRAPMVRLAVLEFYMKYVFENKEMIDDAIKSSKKAPPAPNE